MGELNLLTFTISIEQIDIDENNINFGKNNFKIEIPEEFKKNDHLELTRYLFLKINKFNIIKVGVIFKNDLINISLKSSQINLEYLYNKKNNIIEEIEKEKTEIDSK